MQSASSKMFYFVQELQGCSWSDFDAKLNSNGFGHKLLKMLSFTSVMGFNFIQDNLHHINKEVANRNFSSK
jgi:hypothetical protein